jgi:RimJ/RimL family protein N-acetyltransferase
MITFKPLALRDLTMLLDWLRRPHVAQWWQPEPSLAELEADYFSETTTRAYLPMLDGEPLGFIQSYVAMGSGGGWWQEVSDPGRRGVDQFLADGERLGRGLGRCMMRAFVDRLFEDPAVSSVQTDPSPDNERAVRCYRRAGFVDQGVVQTPDGPALLMLQERKQ